MNDTVTIHVELYSRDSGKEPQSILRVARDISVVEYRDTLKKVDPPMQVMFGDSSQFGYFYALEAWKQREQRRTDMLKHISLDLMYALHDKL